MQRWKSALLLSASDGIPRRAFYVALVVGTVLNVINQGDALIAGQPLDWLKMVLTYLVPYCVSTHGAVAARMTRD
jgi:hypothetical protein